MYSTFRGSFVISSRSIRDEGIRETVESIRQQDLVEWECVFYLDETPHEWELIELSRHSPRFRVGTTSAWHPWSDLRSDLAINVLPGTLLTANAFATIVASYRGDMSLLYGDSTEVVRPDWSPVRYRNDRYFGDVVAFARDVQPNGGIARVRRPLSKGSQASFPPIPRAVSQCLADCAIGDRPETINVVIPTAGTRLKDGTDRRAMILDLIDGIGRQPNMSATVVADSSTPKEVQSALQSLDWVTVVPYEKPFNFSEKCNIGAMASTTDIVLFLNDDMTCVDTKWPDEIRRTLSMKRVGAVGGLLLTNDGLVQCAGHGNTPVPHLFGVGRDPSDPRNHPVLGIEREVSGLSGACVAMRRTDYLALGGMTELLAEGYNDVDLGFKVMSTGKSLIFNPLIRFIHFESATRDPKVNPEEWEFVTNRWGRFFGHDPFTP